MRVASAFRASEAKFYALISAYPLAQLVSPGRGDVSATPLPLVIEEVTKAGRARLITFKLGQSEQSDLLMEALSGVTTQASSNLHAAMSVAK